LWDHSSFVFLSDTPIIGSFKPTTAVTMQCFYEFDVLINVKFGNYYWLLANCTQYNRYTSRPILLSCCTGNKYDIYTQWPIREIQLRKGALESRFGSTPTHQAALKEHILRKIKPILAELQLEHFDISTRDIFNCNKLKYYSPSSHNNKLHSLVANFYAICVRSHNDN